MTYVLSSSLFIHSHSAHIQNERIIGRASVHHRWPGPHKSWSGAFKRIIYVGAGDKFINESVCDESKNIIPGVHPTSPGCLSVYLQYICTYSATMVEVVVAI